MLRWSGEKEQCLPATWRFDQERCLAGLLCPTAVFPVWVCLWTTNLPSACALCPTSPPLGRAPHRLTSTGQRCQMPMLYRGQLYRNCVGRGNGSAGWCYNPQVGHGAQLDGD